MTISQGLKAKNKLIAEIKELYSIAHSFNSIEEGNVRRYNIEQTLSEATDRQKELVELKTRIHVANAPVYGEIFAMGELKYRIKELKRLPIDEGKTVERYGSAISVKNVAVNVAEVASMIKSAESQIEALQAVLDLHNSTTQLK